MAPPPPTTEEEDRELTWKKRMGRGNEKQASPPLDYYTLYFMQIFFELLDKSFKVHSRRLHQ